MTYMKTCHRYLYKNLFFFTFVFYTEPLCCNLFFNKFKDVVLNLDFRKENIFVICVKIKEPKIDVATVHCLTDWISWHFCHAMIYHFIPKP